MENMPVPTEQPVDAPEKSTDDTVVFKRSHFYAVMVIFAFSVGVLVGYMAWGRAATGPVAVQPQNQPSADAGQGNSEEVMQYLVTQARHIDGDDNAEVVIVEFSDYQ
jgi:hypothetical protein